MTARDVALAHLPEIVSALLLIAAYVLLNVWAFARPKSNIGYILLNVVTRFTITAYDKWGFKDLRLPFTSADIPPPPPTTGSADPAEPASKLPATPPDKRT